MGKKKNKGLITFLLVIDLIVIALLVLDDKMGIFKTIAEWLQSVLP